ncbi:MAG: riboflavin biosynthesis protein RibF [Acidimicrobiales bacterium mtb01]|nr:MAG: riboflavin biosynthesis protein RibF [Acidimicrobiales bacterium mtb01]
MIVEDFAERVWPGQRSIVTIGAYDGLHAGHRTVIEHVKSVARERSAKSVIVTFDRHPASLVRPESAPRLLTDQHQKLELLAETGVDAVAIVRFDEAQAAESPDDFVRRVLVNGLGVAGIVVGEDFHFGRGRAGNVALLRTLGRDLDFDVVPHELITAGPDSGSSANSSTVISSTAIRRAIADGEVERANEWLGRPYELRGVVGDGDKRGRTIGFPTANVEVPSAMCIPGDGVYAAWYERDSGPRAGAVYPAAVNVGRRPTFYENQPVSLIEAHVLDNGPAEHQPLDLYGESARLRFVARLRGEQKFDGIDALRAQLDRDIDAARRALG